MSSSAAEQKEGEASQLRVIWCRRSDWQNETKDRTDDKKKKGDTGRKKEDVSDMKKEDVSEKEKGRDTETCLQTALRIIQAEERERIGRLRREEDRMNSLLGRILLRSCAASAMNVGLESIILGRTPSRKPYVVSPDGKGGAEVNVSHHGDVVAAVVHPSMRVGIDVVLVEAAIGEDTERFLRDFDSYFTDAEWEQIRGYPALCVAPEGTGSAEIRGVPTVMVNFYWFWALKESFIKAFGIGISEIKLRSIEFDIPRGKGSSAGALCTGITVKRDGVDVDNCVFELRELPGQHFVVVCVAGEGSAGAMEGVVFEEVVPRDLLASSRPGLPISGS